MRECTRPIVPCSPGYNTDSPSDDAPVAGFIEWLLTYFLIANEEGICTKEELRKCYDGSIFFEKTQKKDNHPVIRNDIK